MIRVAAVVAAMAEMDATHATHASPGERPLKDLIAKAAQVVAGHASAARGIRSRGLAQQGRARESLRIAVSGQDAAAPRTLDLVR
jgi:hypothetical protein